MKKFLIALMCGLIGVIFGVGFYAIADNQGWIPPEKESYVSPIDTVVYTQPLFYTIKDVQKLQTDYIMQFKEDSVFRCIPPDALVNVSTVLLKRDGFLTIEAIVKEYLNNSLIYRTLSSPDDRPEQLSPNRPLADDRHHNKDETTQYQLIDTVIDGTNVKLAKKQ